MKILQLKFPKLIARLLLGLALVVFALPTQAQVTRPNIRSFTNSVTAIAGSAATNLNCTLDLRAGKNHWTMFKFAMGASSTDVITFWLYPVPDGTNRLTAASGPVILSVAANGTTAVVCGTNLPSSTWDGIGKVNLLYASNAHASAVCYLTNTFLINNN